MRGWDSKVKGVRGKLIKKGGQKGNCAGMKNMWKDKSNASNVEVCEFSGQMKLRKQRFNNKQEYDNKSHGDINRI